MSKIVYQELRRRYQDADFHAMTTDELCQALDISCIALDFLQKCNCSSPQEYKFWYNVSSRAIEILQSRSVKIYFVSSLQDLAKVLLEACVFAESAEFLRHRQLSHLSDRELGALMDIILDSQDERAALALRVISQEFQTRN